MAPPRVVPWPPRNLVSEWITISAPYVDRAKKDRCCDGIVDNERHAMLVRHARQFLDIADIARRVPDTFAEDSTRIVIDGLFDGVRMIRLCKARIYALAWKKMRK